MKKIIFASLIILSSSMLYGQQNRNNNRNQRQAPSTVQQAWQKDHPNNGNPTWQMNNGQWHARYKDQTNNRNADTYYDSRGRQLDTHTQWDRKDVPQEVDNRVRTRYHSKNYQVTRIDRPSNPSLFQIILGGGTSRRTVYLDERGNEVRYRDRH
jgi:hypothetical protein